MSQALVEGLKRALGDDRVMPALPSPTFTGHHDRRALCVIRPRNFDEVARTLVVLAAADQPVAVMGGGHGPRSLVDGVACLDLRSIPPEVRAGEGTITVNGSARVADLLSTSATSIVPVGIAPTPGVGLMIMGGVGGLTRSLGLTIDSIESLDIIDGHGVTKTISAAGDADLWFAARGAASGLGVVSSLTLRSHDVPLIWHGRVVTRSPSLGAWAVLAPALPRETSCSVIMVPATDAGEVVVLYDVVSRVPRGLDTALLADGCPVLAQREWQHHYPKFPEFAVPQCAAFNPPVLTASRWRTVALWLAALPTRSVIMGIADAVRLAPTPWCRVDLQHLGGAMADVPDHASALWGRRSEYNLVITANWQVDSDPRTIAACHDWIADVRAVAKPAVIGAYASDLEPGMAGMAQELELVFGENLARLRAVAEIHDADGRFRFAPPFAGLTPGP